MSKGKYTSTLYHELLVLFLTKLYCWMCLLQVKITVRELFPSQIYFSISFRSCALIDNSDPFTPALCSVLAFIGDSGFADSVVAMHVQCQPVTFSTF